VAVIGYLTARERMAAPLERLRAWLTQNNAAVMAVLLLVLDVGLIGKGSAASEPASSAAGEDRGRPEADP
jgi:hypothetical protein